MKETYPGEFKDNAAEAAVADALESYRLEALEAKERYQKALKAITDEDASALMGVSSKTRNRLARYSGWKQHVLSSI